MGEAKNGNRESNSLDSSRSLSPISSSGVSSLFFFMTQDYNNRFFGGVDLVELNFRGRAPRYC